MDECKKTASLLVKMGLNRSRRVGYRLISPGGIALAAPQVGPSPKGGTPIGCFANMEGNDGE